nr:MAG TPA: hypothetical protein [Caudoviricetes sp.]
MRSMAARSNTYVPRLPTRPTGITSPFLTRTLKPGRDRPSALAASVAPIKSLLDMSL